MATDKNRDHLDCAVEMLRGLNSNKSPEEIRSQLIDRGYTQEQIKDAGEALKKSG